MAKTAQSAGTTPLEPTEFWDVYISLGKALQEMRRLTGLALVNVESMRESLHDACGYMKNAHMPEEMRQKTAQVMEGHEAQLDRLGEQIGGAGEEIGLAIDTLDDCVTFVDDMREFSKNAKTWGQLEEVKRGLREAPSVWRASSVIEKIDEAMKHLEHHTNTAFVRR